MTQETFKPEVMELGEDGDTVLVFGEITRSGAADLVNKLIDAWGERPRFDADDLVHLPHVVEGVPDSQRDAAAPDMAYWWGWPEVGELCNLTRLSEGWLLQVEQD